MPMLRWALLTAVASSIVACGPRYRKEMIGHRPVAPAAPAEAIAIAEPGLYQIDIGTHTSRAMVVAYTLECPGVQRRGEIGETFEQYRARRLREIARERERAKQTAGMVVGALVGVATARTGIQTPVGQGTVGAEVDGQAVGEAAADQALAEPELPPGDLGGGPRASSFNLRFATGGQCRLALTANAEPGAVSGSLSVTRLIDIKKEKRAAKAAANRDAVKVRVAMTTELVGLGADPHKRARERAEARAREQAEIRARVQARWEKEAQARAEAAAVAQAELEIRYAEERQARLERDAALAVRGRVTRWLVSCGGEVGRAERLERERRERERIAIARALEIRVALLGRLRGLGADPLYRQRQAEAELRAYEERVRARAQAQRRAAIALERQTRLAVEARARIKSSLIARGAIERPPMPAPRVETRTVIPFSGAVWVEGQWRWNGESWVWLAGTWVRPPAVDAVWVAPREIRIGGSVVIRPGSWMSAKGKRLRIRRR